jgi:hypothetical protein
MFPKVNDKKVPLQIRQKLTQQVGIPTQFHNQNINSSSPELGSHFFLNFSPWNFISTLPLTGMSQVPWQVSLSILSLDFKYSSAASCELIAAFMDESPNVLANWTTKNAHQVFGLGGDCEVDEAKVE